MSIIKGRKLKPERCHICKKWIWLFTKEPEFEYHWSPSPSSSSEARPKLFHRQCYNTGVLNKHDNHNNYITT